MGFCVGFLAFLCTGFGVARSSFLGVSSLCGDELLSACEMELGCGCSGAVVLGLASAWIQVVGATVFVCMQVFIQACASSPLLCMFCRSSCWDLPCSVEFRASAAFSAVTGPHVRPCWGQHLMVFQLSSRGEYSGVLRMMRHVDLALCGEFRLS